MQRGVLLGAGAVVLAVVGFMAFRSTTNRQVGHALDQGIDQLLTRLPPGYAVRHGATEANPLTSSLTVHDVVVLHDGATIWTADQVTVSGADRQALQDVFDPASYPNGHPAWSDRRLLIADASARNLHATAPGADSLMRSYTLHRLSGRPFLLPPTKENRGRPEFLADAALAFSVDSLEGRDEKLTTTAKSSATIAIGGLALSDYDAGKIGSLAFTHMAADGDGKPRGGPFHLEVGNFDVKNLDMRGVLEAVRQSGHADRGQFGKLSYESGDLSGLSFDMANGPHLGVDDIHAVQTVTDAGSIGKGYMHGFTMALGQTRLPPAAAPALAAFGMNALTMDIEAATHTTTVDRRMTVHEDLALHELGKLHVDATLSGYDPAQASADKPMGAILGTTLDHAVLSYEDDSLVNRVLAVAALQAHTTPDLLRAQLAMPVMALAVMLPDQPDAADQITAFLTHPGTLAVTLAPPQKITLAEVAQAPVTSRAHLLGAHVAAK